MVMVGCCIWIMVFQSLSRGSGTAVSLAPGIVVVPLLCLGGGGEREGSMFGKGMICVCVHPCMCVCASMYMCACMCVCMHVCVRPCTYMCACVCVCKGGVVVVV